jgi:uncharacterized membrane protein
MQTTSVKRSSLENWRWLYALFAIVLAMGIFFRFANLDKKVYWNDEAVTSLRISGYTEAEIIQQVYDGRAIDVSEIMEYQRPNPNRGLDGVINSLATEDAHLSLLYHFLARLWLDWFGSSTAAIRSLSALLSLLAFPCLYWLCRELFNSPLTGWIAMALMAVSPFHVLYAQEARQYSLWTVAILLSSAALLRALRVQTKISWVVYAATVALAIYSHTLSILVVAGHGIYVLFVERFRLSKRFFVYLLSIIGGFLAFVPWLIVAIAQSSKISSNVSRTNINIGLPALIKSWCQSLYRIFVDIPNLGDYFFPVIFLLTIYALYYLVRKSSKETFLFVSILIGTTLALAIPDILLGGKRSSDSRYLIPSYIGIELAIAYLFSTQLVALKSWQQKLWSVVLIALLSVGIVSCAISSQAQTWWNKSSGYYNPQIAEIINKTSNTLVISDNTPGRILSLSHLLDERIKLLLLSQPDSLKIPKDFSNIFIYQPSSKLETRLDREKNYHLKDMLKGWLWKLDKIGDR